MSAVDAANALPPVRSPYLGTLALCVGLSALTLNMFVASLPAIAEEFGTSYAVANLAIGGYLAVTAIMQLIMGPLSDRYGRRPILLFGLSVYIVGSIVCLFAGGIELFLFGRVLQTASITGYILSMAMIRDTSPPQEAAGRIGNVAALMSLGPILGPSLGGFVDHTFGWRAVFVLYALLGLGLLLLVRWDVQETNRARSETFRSQLATYPELFRSRRFWGYAFCGAFSTATFFCFISGAPLAGRAVFGLNSAELGFAIGSISIGFLVGNLMTGRYAKTRPLWELMIIGRCAALLGMAMSLLVLMLGSGSAIAFFAPLILMGFGNGLTIPNTNAGVVSVRPKLAGSAAGLGGALTVATGAVMTSLTGTLVSGPSAALTLLGILMFCGVAGLIAALYVRHIDLLEAASE